MAIPKFDFLSLVGKRLASTIHDAYGPAPHTNDGVF
jgi:hypothetical protein